jgi:uncharacterized protein YggE
MIMAIVIIAVLVVFGALLVLAYSARALRGVQNSMSTNISVTGNANVSVSPNEGSITFAVSTNSTNATMSAQMNAQTTANVRSALLAMGYGNRSVTTNYYSIQPIYCIYNYYTVPIPLPVGSSNTTISEKGNATANNIQHFCTPQSIIGYQTVQSLTLNITAINSTGRLIDTITNAGGNYVSIGFVTFGLNAASDKAAHKQALTAAMDNASIEAGTLAAAANEKISRIVSVTEQAMEYGIYPYSTNNLSATPSGSGAVSTQITPGKIIVAATVSAVYSASPA